MKEQCQKEIEELHQFFEQWYNGVIPSSTDHLSRFENALSYNFNLITPEGKLFTKETILNLVKRAYGTRQDQLLFIWTKNFRFKELTPNYLIVMYEEWQKIADNDIGRLSTAIFRKNNLLDSGVEWLHVHETWLPK